MEFDIPPEVAITEKIVDADTEDTVFGKRWGSQVFHLTEQDLSALREGKYLALDIREEYIAYLTIAPAEQRHD